MASRQPRKRRLQFDDLERRETPSALVGAEHGIHELVARRRPAAVAGTAFKGTASGMPISKTDLPNGGIAAVEILQGNASRIGNFSGALSTTFAPDFLHITNSAVLTAADGSQLDLSFTGVLRKMKEPTLKGTFPFTVTGGTGTFAATTGSGTINATLNANNGALTLTISGKLLP